MGATDRRMNAESGAQVRVIFLNCRTACNRNPSAPSRTCPTRTTISRLRDCPGMPDCWAPDRDPGKSTSGTVDGGEPSPLILVFQSGQTESVPPRKGAGPQGLANSIVVLDSLEGAGQLGFNPANDPLANIVPPHSIGQ